MRVSIGITASRCRFRRWLELECGKTENTLELSFFLVALVIILENSMVLRKTMYVSLQE